VSKENFDHESLKKIISLHDEYLSEAPKTHLELYECEDAIMWDGYIQPIVELNEIIGSLFRLNAMVEPVDIAEAYKPGGIESLSLNQIGFVFRDILINEKFHQGLFAGVIMDGRLTRLINRLKDIL